MVVLAVTWMAKAGREAEVAAVFAKLAEESRKEGGCLIYQVHRHKTDPRRFFVYEQYKDDAALEAHRSAPHFLRYVRKELPKIGDRIEGQLYEPLGCGPGSIGPSSRLTPPGLGHARRGRGTARTHGAVNGAQDPIRGPSPLPLIRQQHPARSIALLRHFMEGNHDRFAASARLFDQRIRNALCQPALLLSGSTAQHRDLDQRHGGGLRPLAIGCQ